MLDLIPEPVPPVIGVALRPLPLMTVLSELMTRGADGSRAGAVLRLVRADLRTPPHAPSAVAAR